MRLARRRRLQGRERARLLLEAGSLGARARQGGSGGRDRVAEVVLRRPHELASALEPELIRAFALLEGLRRQSVYDRTQAIQRLRAIWTQVDPEAEAKLGNCASARALRKLKRIELGEGLAARAAARCIRELAAEIEQLNCRVAHLDSELAALLDEYGNPIADLVGAGPAVAVALIAHSGDVRRFKSQAAYARFCGAAPIPCGSGKTADHHRFDRGGNRQLNAALHRIAIVQARVDPRAAAFLARKIAEGKTKREARRALKRHLANVVYRRLQVWAQIALAAETDASMLSRWPSVASAGAGRSSGRARVSRNGVLLVRSCLWPAAARSRRLFPRGVGSGRGRSRAAPS